MLIKDRRQGREVRHRRIRQRVRGTADRPRLVVFRSLSHIYAQLIDDEAGKTLLAASTLSPGLKGTPGGNAAAAKLVGEMIAQKAKAAGIEQVVFDRGGYKYHGRVKALAEAARAGGLRL